MKIRKLTPEKYDKASAMLRQAFSKSTYEVQLVEKLHKNKTNIHEWVCIHVNTVIAYIAFSNAYKGSDICGYHLALIGVKPEFQKQGIGSELLRFALRQDFIKANTIFVLGNESEGVSQAVEDICDKSVAIPMQRGVESLNVAVTASLLAFL